MKTNQIKTETLEALLARVHPDTRVSLDDAKIAGNELREIARQAGFVGPVVDKTTGKFSTEFINAATK